MKGNDLTAKSARKSGFDLIVSLSVAKIARKRGFDEKTSFGYCFDRTQDGYYTDYDPDYFVNSTLWEKHYAAPTREQLHSWLQKQGVFVVIDIDQTHEPKFAYKVVKYLGDGNWDDEDKNRWSDLYYQYDQVLEAGLVDALDRMV